MFASLIWRYRYTFFFLPIVLSIFSIILTSRLRVITKTKDFIPTNHPYIKVQARLNEIFGGLSRVNIAIHVNQGTILDPEILKDLKAIFDDILYLNDVNPRRVLCIFSRQIKEIRIFPDGFEVKRLIEEIPHTQKELTALRIAIQKNPLVYGPLVSKDFKSTIIQAEFREDAPSKRIYQQLMSILAAHNHGKFTYYVSGRPILEGYIEAHLGYIIYAFALSFLIVLALLFVFFRSKRGFVLPLCAGTMSVLITLGILSLLNYPLNPLTILIPFLIFMVSITHSIQFVERYFELEAIREKKELVSRLISSLLSPVRASIITDFLGFFSLFFIPIPAVKYMAISGSCGILSIFITVVCFLPACFAIIPQQPHSHKKQELGITLWALKKFSRLYRKKSILICLVLLGITASLFGIARLRVGETEVGSSMLYANSPYNRAERFINDNFSGSVSYYILVSGKGKDSLINSKAMEEIDSLESYLKQNAPGVGYGLSVADHIKLMNMAVFGGDKEAFRIPSSTKAIGEYMFLLESNSFPGVFSALIDPSHMFANIRLDLKDIKKETIEAVINKTKEWIKRNKGLHNLKFEFPGGLAGIEAAKDEIIKDGIKKSLFIISMLIFIRISYALRSAIGGAMLLAPLLLSILITFGSLGLLGIPLTIATIPIAALGAGLGIDYSIYLASRIKEEVQHNIDLPQAIEHSIMTCGKALLFTGLILTIGLFSWFLSSLKLHAKLGCALGFLILMNMTFAFVLVPAIFFHFKPSFLRGGGR